MTKQLFFCQLANRDAADGESNNLNVREASVRVPVSVCRWRSAWPRKDHSSSRVPMKAKTTSP